MAIVMKSFHFFVIPSQNHNNLVGVWRCFVYNHNIQQESTIEKLFKNMDKNGDGVVTKEVGSDILSTHAHTKSLQQNKTNHCNKTEQISVELLVDAHCTSWANSMKKIIF